MDNRGAIIKADVIIFSRKTIVQWYWNLGLVTIENESGDEANCSTWRHRLHMTTYHVLNNQWQSTNNEHIPHNPVKNQRGVGRMFQVGQVKVQTAKVSKHSHKHSHCSLPFYISNPTSQSTNRQSYKALAQTFSLQLPLLYFKSGKSKYKPPKLVSARTNTLITAFPLYLFFGKNANRKATWVQRTIIMTRSS